MRSYISCSLYIGAGRNEMVLHSFKCERCKNVTLSAPLRPGCSVCGGIVLAEYDYQAVAAAFEAELAARPSGMWRYRELLPVHWPSVISLGEGGTFLHRCGRLAEHLRLKELFVKDETSNPTGAFLDRGISVAVSHAYGSRFDALSCWTTGNLGASLAAYAAKAGMRCKVFVPPWVDLGKLYQMIAYGAEVVPSKDLEEARDSSLGLGDGWYPVSPSNVFLLEGEKTTAFEICEAFNWNSPDRIIVPVGNGGHLAMMRKGLKELSAVRLLRGDHLVINGVGLERVGSSKGSGAGLGLMGGDLTQTDPDLYGLALEAVQQDSGTILDVSQKEVFEATTLLARTEGIFAEPAASSTVAGLMRLVAQGEVDRDEMVVLVITGSGLKDPLTARRLVKGSLGIEKILETVEGRKLTAQLGMTKLRLLELLAERERYGYEIWRELGTRYGHHVKLPSIYQHLNELEVLGVVRRTRTRRVLGRPERSYYALTEKGKTILRAADHLKM